MKLETESWPLSQRIIFLAYLAHELTVSARMTYEPGTENVTAPQLLRAFNEVQHHVTGALRDHILQKNGVPLSTLLEGVRSFGLNHEIGKSIDSAIADVLDRTVRAAAQ